MSSVAGAVSQKRPSAPANLQQQRSVIQRRLNVFFISAEEERSNGASDGLRLCPSPSLDQLGPPALVRYSNCCIKARTTTSGFSRPPTLGSGNKVEPWLKKKKKGGAKMVVLQVLAPKISTSAKRKN